MEEVDQPSATQKNKVNYIQITRAEVETKFLRIFQTQRQQSVHDR